MFGYTLSNSHNLKSSLGVLSRFMNKDDYFIFDFPDLFCKDDFRLDPSGSSANDQEWYHHALQIFLKEPELAAKDVQYKTRVEDFFSGEQLLVKDRVIQTENLNNYRVRIRAEIEKLDLSVEIQRYGRMSPGAVNELLAQFGWKCLGNWSYPGLVSNFYLFKY